MSSIVVLVDFSRFSKVVDLVVLYIILDIKRDLELLRIYLDY